MNEAELTRVENDSIRGFLTLHREFFRGDVLDYGCGQQPYRDIVEGIGATYHGFDRMGKPANMSGRDIGPDDMLYSADWDVILCTQVIQYIPVPVGLLRDFYSVLAAKHGHLVMTYPTNWPEVDDGDLWRFTMEGMDRLLADAGFEVVRHEGRHGFGFENFSLSCGYGVVART